MRADTFTGVLVLFVVCGGVSTFLEWRWPERQVVPKLARGRWLDWAWWPATAFLTGNLTRVLAVGLVACVVLGTGVAATPSEVLPALEASPFGVGLAPVPVQIAVALLLGDLVNYWNHRLRHTRWLWPFHAVHHRPVQLDWLSSVHIHPVDDLIDGVSVGLVLVAAGVSIPVWLATGPFLLFWDMWLHGNVALPAERGWLVRCMATPGFHRWHHAGEAPSCNFAGVFPLWDVIFGTFFLPQTAPLAFGSGAEEGDGLVD